MPTDPRRRVAADRWLPALRDLAAWLSVVAASVFVIVRVVTLWTTGRPLTAAAIITLGAVGGVVGAAWGIWTDR